MVKSIDRRSGICFPVFSPEKELIQKVYDLFITIPEIVRVPIRG